ncbi:hypothetical protein PG984_010467 [Apiospora sp. TS-2023a]
MADVIDEHLDLEQSLYEAQILGIGSNFGAESSFHDAESSFHDDEYLLPEPIFHDFPVHVTKNEVRAMLAQPPPTSQPSTPQRKRRGKHSQMTPVATGASDNSDSNSDEQDVLGLALPSRRRQVTPSVAAKKYKCSHSSCLWAFDQPKGLRRHMETQHADLNVGVFICKCKYETPIKSNYVRHLRTRLDSRCTYEDVRSSFGCKCGSMSFEDLDDVFQHLVGCESLRERVGRPRRPGPCVSASR